MPSRREVLTRSLPALTGAVAQPAGAVLPDVLNVPDHEIFSRAIFDDYVALYNAGDLAFTRYLTADVVMESSPPLVGRRAIADHVSALRAYVTERISVEAYSAGRSMVMVQVLAAYRCHRDLPVTALGAPFGQALCCGQEVRIRGSLLYEVEGGRFSRIRPGRAGTA